MLEKLSAGLKEALRKIAKAGYIDSATVEELVKDLQRTLLAADVDVKLVFELTQKIKKRALNEKPAAGLTAKEHVVRIVYEELVNFVGKKPEISLKPQKILFIGLFGSGKTTSIGKLAKFYQKKGLKPALIGCDVHRPAAMQQLEQIAQQLNIPCYAPNDLKNPVEIALKGTEQFRKYDLLIFDSSGRDALDKELANELKKLGETIKPEEVLLVIPADLGQAARPQAEEFSKLVGITGVFITKIDGTAKGGGALTACAVTGVPVKFLGIGEKLDAVEVFEPERFISRLIGFGDLQSLLEKAKEVIPEQKAKQMAEKLQEGKFTLTDFYEQIKAMSTMGGLGSIMNQIPGMGGIKLPKEFDMRKQEDKMKRWSYAIQSMTQQEKESPETINHSRISRISKGSGVGEAEVRELLRSYEQAKKVMKMMSGRGGLFGKMAKRFKL